MSTTIIYTPPEVTGNELRPLVNGKVNLAWALQRLPMVILSIESAYGVFKYLLLTGTVELVAYIGALGFDLVFIGMIALADQIRNYRPQDNDANGPKIDGLFWAINIGALLASFAFSLLYHSNGSYALVTAESFTRSVVFPFMSLLYALYFDNRMRTIKNELDERKRARDEVLKEYPLVCPYCDRRFKADEAKRRSGHISQCASRPIQGTDAASDQQPPSERPTEV